MSLGADTYTGCATGAGAGARTTTAGGGACTATTAGRGRAGAAEICCSLVTQPASATSAAIAATCVASFIVFKCGSPFVFAYVVIVVWSLGFGPINGTALQKL
ncbi:hypothetical protein BN2476_100094 [Paraburkholderia piptadeniae]|uniref:Uncharacterized protein n=1 Tax=Paraburkholderia piptadeniae TaxID=1701573 RepID=A0A1N7RQ08_9BURK|nr:hypothetical protein BN2476_100094 [Paraburkholderia piptadeniae]